MGRQSLGYPKSWFQAICEGGKETEKQQQQKHQPLSLPFPCNLVWKKAWTDKLGGVLRPGELFSPHGFVKY